MVRRAAFLCLLGCILLGITAFTKARVAETKTLIARATETIVQLDRYCDGRKTAFINSGTTTTILTLPSSPHPGTKCNAVIAASAIISLSSADNIYGSDGSVINYYQVAAANSLGTSISATAIDSSHWTIDELYGNWTEVP